MQDTRTHGWTLQRKAKAAGVYYQLIKTGRGPDGKRTSIASIALSSEGREVSETEALNALANVRAVASEGGEPRLLTLYGTATAIHGHPAPDPTGTSGTSTGRASVVAYLLSEGTDALTRALTDVPEPEPDPADLTLIEYHDRIFWPVRSGRVPDGACRKVAATTINGERRVWSQIRTSPLGATRLEDLDPWIFQAYLDGLTVKENPTHKKQRGDVGATAGGNTRRLHRAAYQALLNFAHRKGHVRSKHEFFPIFGVTQGTVPKEEPLTLDEVTALLDHEVDPMRRCLWAVAIGMGPRPSEVSRIKWEDIRPDGTMHIRGTKTEDSWAVVPLTPLARTEIDRYRATFGARTPTGHMFHFRGQPILDYGDRLATAAKRAGIAKRVHPYLLRHSFATLAYVLGMSKDVTRRIGRWTDEKMLDDVYCRPRAVDLVPSVATFTLPPVVEVEDDNGWLRMVGAA